MKTLQSLILALAATALITGCCHTGAKKSCPCSACGGSGQATTCPCKSCPAK